MKQTQWSRRNLDGTCRKCGTALPPMPVSPGRPRELCDKCRQQRGQVLVPKVGAITSAVDQEFGDSPDWRVQMLRHTAMCLDGAQTAGAVVALGREFRRLMEEIHTS